MAANDSSEPRSAHKNSCDKTVLPDRVSGRADGLCVYAPFSGVTLRGGLHWKRAKGSDI